MAEGEKLERLQITLSETAMRMLRDIIQWWYPGRQRQAGVVIEEALRRLYEEEVKKR